MKIKNEQGEEVEVLTTEEVEAKLATEKAAIETGYKDVVTEKDTTINTLAKEKADLEAKISKLEIDGVKDDHPNFKVLKEALAKKDSDIQGLRTSIEDDKKQRVSEEMDSKIKIASKGNDEFEKKVRLHLEKSLSGLPEGTKEERQAKLEMALKLSSDGSMDGQGMFDGGVGGGGFGGGNYGAGNSNAVEFTAREKALGAKMGITEEDYKKYGAKVSKKN